MAECFRIIHSDIGTTATSLTAEAVLVGQRTAYETASLAHFTLCQRLAPDTGEVLLAHAKQQELAVPLTTAEVSDRALQKADVLVLGDLFARALVPQLLVRCIDACQLSVNQTLPYWQRTLDDPVEYVRSTARQQAHAYVGCALETGQDARRSLWAALRLGFDAIQ